MKTTEADKVKTRNSDLRSSTSIASYYKKDEAFPQEILSPAMTLLPFPNLFSREKEDFRKSADPEGRGRGPYEGSEKDSSGRRGQKNGGGPE
jgi:hypothetical protein